MLTKAATGAAITAFLALLVQARNREQNALVAKVQKRQSEDEATIAELREHLSTLEAQLGSTSAQNPTLTEGNKAGSLSTQKSVDTFPEDLSSARGREGQRDAKIAELEAAPAEDETAVADLRQELLTLSARILSTSAQNHPLTEESEKDGADFLSEDLSNAREEVAQHNATITDSQEAQAEDEATFADLLEQLSTLSAPLLSKSGESRALTEEKKEYESSSLSMMQESIDTPSKDVLRAREEVAQHKATITYLEGVRDEDESTIAALRQELLALKARLLSTNDENRALTEGNKEHEASSPSKQESIDTLSEGLSSTREEVAQPSATITALKALTKENKEYEARFHSMKESIDTLHKDLSSAIEKVARRKAKIKHLKQGQAEDKTKIADLRQQLSTSKVRFLLINDENRAWVEENKRYEADSISMQEFIETLSEDLLSAREEHNATITHLKAAKAKEESTIADLREQLSTLEAHRVPTGDDEECDTSSLSMQEVIKTLSEDLWTVKERVTRRDAMIVHLKEVQTEDETTIAVLLQQLSTLETQLTSTNEENRALMEKNKEYEASFLSKKESMDTLSKELSIAIGRVGRRNATITHLKEGQAEDKTTIADLRQQLSMSKKSIDTLFVDLSSARQELVQHNATITDLKAAQAKSEAKNTQLRDKLFEVSIKNISMGDQLDRGEHLEVRRPSTESGVKGKSSGVSEGSSHAF
ncbi:hypothetical protein EST38_g8999 [Candolleomyces aberdarensis]|uniref:Uncharacterized protein n=1 Tax=Candolleomyces aberdarensis TaxID=2316362 RepID=A0A4Q2DB13_9AGAR|nr:hypothetical protein EST38_g8999 [Candolleomyces aberdarensis]